MSKAKERDLVVELLQLIDGIGSVIKTAKKHKCSLVGQQYYGIKFTEFQIALTKKRKELKARVESIENADLKAAMDSIETDFDSILDPKRVKKEYASAKRHLKLVLLSEMEVLLKDSVSSSVPLTDYIVPMEIVKGTREYIEKVTIQVNGCYDRGWFDGCAVMIRRLVETLIIECFEHSGISNKIKDNQGVYFYLGQLIDAFLQEGAWQPKISRNTKNHLPKLKDIGDLSAHSRYFIAKKPDIDRVRDWVRVVVQELVHIAELK